jgi:hypothetical protein
VTVNEKPDAFNPTPPAPRLAAPGRQPQNRTVPNSSGFTHRAGIDI